MLSLELFHHESIIPARASEPRLVLPLFPNWSPDFDPYDAAWVVSEISLGFSFVDAKEVSALVAKDYQTT